MIMKTQSKSLKRMLHYWCEIVYQRNLEAELLKLYREFQQWQGGAVNAFELTQAIHKFHQGPAKDLYVRYVMGGPGLEDILVAAAVRDGVIKAEELPSELVEILPQLGDEPDEL